MVGVGISTKEAPAAIGPYSQAVKAGQTVYISGQLGLNPDTMTMEENVVKQAERSLTNVQNIVKAAGGTMKDIVSTTVLLADMADFNEVNAIYQKFFPTAGSATPPPARACFSVKGLPKGGLIEIAAVAYIN